MYKFNQALFATLMVAGLLCFAVFGYAVLDLHRWHELPQWTAIAAAVLGVAAFYAAALIQRDLLEARRLQRDMPLGYQGRRRRRTS